MRTIFYTLLLLPAFALFTTSCDRGKKKTEQENTLAEIDRTVAEAKKNLEKELDKEGGIGFKDTDSKMQREMSDKFGELASKSTGQEAIAAEVAQVFLLDVSALVDRMSKAATKLQLAMNFEGVERPEDFDQMSTYAREYQATNAEVKDQFANELIENLKVKAKAKGLEGKSYTDFFIGMTSTYNKQLPYLMKIRDTDNQLCEAIIEQHKLLRKHWGAWEWSAADESISFSNDDTLNAYNKVATDIQKIAEEQAEAQRNLLSSTK